MSAVFGQHFFGRLDRVYLRKLLEIGYGNGSAPLLTDLNISQFSGGDQVLYRLDWYSEK